jgi:DNA-binding beta-propeller fold protein YncE
MIGASGTSSTLLYKSRGMTVDLMGNVYVADTNNNRIQFFLADETNGTTIAGSPTGVARSSATLLHSP